MIDPLELHAYADGELDKQGEARVRKLLESDAATQAELECIQNLKSSLKQHCQGVECEKTWQACVGRLNELDKTRRTESFVGRYAWALCGVFLLFILAGGVTSRLRPGGNMASPDLARAVASLGQINRPSTQQPEAVRQWLDSLVGRASALVSPDRITVEGAATGEIDGHRVVKMWLRDNVGELALLAVNSRLDMQNMTPSSDRRFMAGKVQGVNCVAWTDGSLAVALVADRSYDELVKAASNIVENRN